MTKLPSDAFLPSGGGLDSNSNMAMPAAPTGPYAAYPNGNSASIASPPPSPAFASRGNHMGHTHSNPSPSMLPPLAAAGSFPSSSLPLSHPDAAPGAARAELPPFNFRPSHMPFDSSPYHRSHSLSPTSTGPTSAPPPQFYNGRHFPSNNFQSNISPSNSFPPGNAAALAAPVGTSLSRSVSADAAAPQQTSLHLVQRLAQQNSLIREAWEAERNYLEANRRRAEEVYQEERAIMEDVREEWHSERDGLLREMQYMKESIQQLQNENATLKAVAAQSVQITGVVSPLASQRGGSIDASAENSILSDHKGLPPLGQFQNSSQQGGISKIDPDSLPPGLDGASRRPHFASPGSSRTSPTRQPEFSPFIPLDPRTQPENATAHDFLSPSSEDLEAPIPIIDVQEIDPKLDGIPIKVNAVQRSTFSEASNPSSPATSPPTAATRHHGQDRPMVVKRGSSKDQTIQVLAAEESRRRTMHAGHTPNHSLSLFPTITLTEGNSTSGRSEGTTPLASARLGPLERREHHNGTSRGDRMKEVAQESEQIERTEAEVPSPIEANDYEEGILEPTDDVPLKGPLMIKNIPAQDEIFWAQVNKKLEPISHGQNSLPTVMRRSSDENDEAPGPASMDGLAHSPGIPGHPVGGDASHDDQAEEEVDDPSKTDVMPDIQLKFKSTTNFGAPFGVM